MNPPAPRIAVQGLAISAGGRLIQQGLQFEVAAGEVLAVVGRSGCGKSTLLRHLVGLQPALAGQVLLDGEDLLAGSEAEQAARCRRMGVMFQAGALWGSMTLAENLDLPMRLFTSWPAADRARHAAFLLALVGLPGSLGLRPAALSGGMRKRAALARALALQPPVLVLDEPGSGLDPVNAARLDRLVRQLATDLRTAVVMVTHDVDSVYRVADRALYLNEETRSMSAIGPPAELARLGPPEVRQFFARDAAGPEPALRRPADPASPLAEPGAPR